MRRITFEPFPTHRASSRAGILFTIFILLACLLSAFGCFDPGEPALSAKDLTWSSADLTDVTIFAPSQAVVVSSNGSIYRSADAGQTWRRTHADPNHPLYAISMGAGGVGFAVGDARILATRDGGQTWSGQVLPANQQAARLRAVARVDGERAVAVGLDGVRLVTSNAGALWRDRSQAVESPASRKADVRADRSLEALVDRWQIPAVELDADLFGVVCLEDPQARCLSLGAPGGTAYSSDSGENWILARRRSPVEIAPLRMDERAFELRGPGRERLLELGERLRQSADFEVRIEPFASETEIERVARARDPEALFEILELRTKDARTILEEAGVDATSIRAFGAPPWDFGDLIDDDPEMLERYYRKRRADTPGVLVSVSLTEPLSDAAFVPAAQPSALNPPARDWERVVATSRLGTLWESVDAGASFELAGEQPAEEVASAFAARDAIWLFGVGGSLRSAAVAQAEIETGVQTAGRPITQKLLRAVDFSRSGHFGLCVGDSGTLLRFEAPDSKWVPVLPEAL